MRCVTAIAVVVIANVLTTFLAVSAQQRGVSNVDIRRFLEGNGTMDPSILHTLTPSTPNPDNVECHVQVKRVEYIGGRCIPLGERGIRACQAGEFLEPYSRDCGGRGSNQRNPQRHGRRTFGRLTNWGRPLRVRGRGSSRQ